MKKVLLLAVIASIIASCDKLNNNPDPDPEDNPESVLAEGNIGSSGGIIEAEGIILTIPSGSFSDAVTVQILAGEESDNVFGDNLITGLYRIDGLPNDFTIPVEVAIECSGSLANEN